MICISKGLLPDFEEFSEEKPEAVISFSYDNTLEEVDGAMKTFQQKFAGKKGNLATIAYAIFTVAVIAAIFLNPKSIMAYAALIFCGFGFYYSLTDKTRTRKKTIEALKDMSPEEYTASFYPDRIELETIIKPKENEVNLNIDEDADKEIISPLKSVFVFETDLLDFAENDESLLLIFNRRQIYCFPKRCLSTEQEEQVRDFLTEKLS
ncbi:MAG: YcxB family protein [Oscillospiraceae bacterium]